MSSGNQPAPPPFVRMAGHPVRWRLLRELARSDCRVRELVTLLDRRRIWFLTIWASCGPAGWSVRGVKR
jgi:hypothetical protein